MAESPKKAVAKTADSWCETRFYVVKTTFVWNIQNFHMCHEDTGRSFDSSTFESDEETELKFHLRLFARGECNFSSEYVSVYLVSEQKTDRAVITNLQLSALDIHRTKRHTWKLPVSKVTSLNNDISSWGTQHFLKRAIALNPASNLLHDGTLCVLCEIELVVRSGNVAGKTRPCIKASPESSLGSDLMKALHAETLSDVTLVCESKEIKAHKVILSARSTMFAAMFAHDMAENANHRVELQDIEFETLQEVITFMYCGAVSHMDKMAENLLVVADRYGMQELKTMCENYLVSTLDLNNVISRLSLADYYKAQDLKAKSVDFINMNALAVKTADGKYLVMSD